MRLTQYSYSEYHNTPKEWKVEKLSLQNVNLVVGKNSSGKSRTLNTLTALSKLLSNRQKPMLTTGEWLCEFEDGEDKYVYELKVVECAVVSEIFTRNGKDLLRRGPGGTGQIYHTKLDQLSEFNSPVTDLAAVNRRDALQHSFFDKLHDWGASVFSYRFGTQLGQLQYAIPINAPIEFDPYDQERVISIFRRGMKDFPDRFVDAIKADMEKIGYYISSIETAQPSGVQLEGIAEGLGLSLLGIRVKEHDLNCITEQTQMSQGMFRALSVIIQFNYAQMSAKAGCVIVDDIGEGLDFERSCELIDLLISKAEPSNVQLILSTNDRFVMNQVPLKSWSVLKRESGTVHVFNYANSQKRFDDFVFMGMNNFDFFATDFLDESLDNPPEEEANNEEASSVR